MKIKSYLLLCIIFLSTIFLINAQTNKVTYQYTSPIKIDIAVLYYNDTVSFFNYGAFSEGKDETNKQTSTNTADMSIVIDDSDSIGTYQYISNEKIYERRNIKKKYYTIIEKFTPLDWQLIDSTQKIGNYTCQLASTFCYGQTFYAWYTSEIPSDKAPWKLGGLPGLILHAYDKERKHEWKATNIEFDVEFDFSVYPSDDEKITLKKYSDLREEENQKIMRLAETIAAQHGGSVSFEQTNNYLEKEIER